MFKSALICTDLTDGLQRLVNFTHSLAASGLQKIVFLHVVPLSAEREIPRLDDAELEKVRDRLSPALKNPPDGVEVAVEVVWGKPSDQISNVSQKYQADLIILGMPIRSRLDEKVFGSTTINMCQRLRTPVLTLRPQLVATYTTEELDLRCRHLFRYVLVPYDGSESGQYLVQQVKQCAQREGTTLTHGLVAWIVDEGGRRQIPRDYQIGEAQKKTAEVKAELEQLGLTVVTEVRQGEPVAQILELANEFDISAIATSSKTLGRLIEWSVPSVTGEILRRSWHPVIYFPPNK